MGRVFLHSAQKNFGGRLWRKAGLASLIPHLGLCSIRTTCPHGPGGGPFSPFLRIGASIRVNKQSFDSWFAAL